MANSGDATRAQALVFKGFGALPSATILWLRVTDLARAREVLREHWLPQVEYGAESSGARTAALQLAFSGAGLRRLGAPDAAVEELGRAFARGIGEPQRRRALGDLGANDPSGWRWDDRRADVVLLLYGASADAAQSLAARVLTEATGGLEPLAQLITRLPADGREPFGFRDGLAQPSVARAEGRRSADELSPGEVLLGHANATGTVPRAPKHGVDGTFLVLRELEQDVAGFWNDWLESSRDAREAVWLASKAVGRWPNGMPVHGSAPCDEPPFDERVALAPLVFRDDLHGDNVPLGAHIRRAHPRDGLVADAEHSLAIAARHRLLRRGRVYGAPTPAHWLPWNAASNAHPQPLEHDGQSRGLLFACLCADPVRQFEFVQQTWMNNPKHADLFDEVDPIAAGAERLEGHFSIPRDPLRRRVSGLAQRVTVRGGGYFFMPARGALDAWLA
jgi:Dyp-type peroxidase family